MLTARLSDATRGDDRAVGEAIVAALTADPLTPHLDGAVMIGARGVGLVHGDDASPRVLVVLGEHDADDALARANAARADAIVTIGARARAAIAPGAQPGTIIIAVDDHREVPRAFLVGATDHERAGAWRVVRRHRALGVALGMEAPNVLPPPKGMRRIIEAILEAVVAVARDYTARMERPAG